MSWLSALKDSFNLKQVRGGGSSSQLHPTSPVCRETPLYQGDFDSAALSLKNRPAGIFLNSAGTFQISENTHFTLAHIACFSAQTQTVCGLWGCQIASSPPLLPLPLLLRHLARVLRRCQAEEGIFPFFFQFSFFSFPLPCYIWFLRGACSQLCWQMPLGGCLPSTGLGCEGSESVWLSGAAAPLGSAQKK